VVVVEVENEEYNERSEERGRRRDGETRVASESKKTSLALARQDMLVPLLDKGTQGHSH